MRIANDLPSQSKLREIFDFLPVTGELIWKPRKDRVSQWNGRHSGKVVGSVCGNDYRYTKIDGRRCVVHRLIWKLAYGSIPNNMMIDHRDQDKSNNRLDNLRLATNGQNQFNKRAQTHKKFKGVYSHKGKFKAEITHQKERFYLGLFECEVEAAKAFDKKAKDLHGEFAQLNFTESGLQHEHAE